MATVELTDPAGQPLPGPLVDCTTPSHGCFATHAEQMSVVAGKQQQLIGICTSKFSEMFAGGNLCQWMHIA